MRILVLLPVAVLAAAACGSEKIETASTSVPSRDLTLQSKLPVPQVEIASAVELARPRAQRVLTRARSKPRPQSRPTAAPTVLTVVEPVPAIRLTVAQPLAQPPTTTLDAPVNDRELPPGKTVTVIPASSGPSVAPEPGEDDAPPAWGRPLVRGGGGTCHGRGGRRPGIGIAAVPWPRLR